MIKLVYEPGSLSDLLPQLFSQTLLNKGLQNTETTEKKLDFYCFKKAEAFYQAKFLENQQKLEGSFLGYCQKKEGGTFGHLVSKSTTIWYWQEFLVQFYDGYGGQETKVTITKAMRGTAYGQMVKLSNIQTNKV